MLEGAAVGQLFCVLLCVNTKVKVKVKGRYAVLTAVLVVAVNCVLRVGVQGDQLYIILASLLQGTNKAIFIWSGYNIYMPKKN